MEKAYLSINNKRHNIYLWIAQKEKKYTSCNPWKTEVLREKKGYGLALQ